MQHDGSAHRSEQVSRETAYQEGFSDGFTTAIELVAQMFERDGLHDVAEVVRQAEVRERIEE